MVVRVHQEHKSQNKPAFTVNLQETERETANLGSVENLWRHIQQQHDEQDFNGKEWIEKMKQRRKTAPYPQYTDTQRKNKLRD